MPDADEIPPHGNGAVPPGTPASHGLRFFAPGLVVVLGSILALGAFALVRHYENKWETEDFRALARGPAQELKRQTEDAVEVLLSVGQLFATSKQVEPADFRAFTAAPMEDHPEIYSVAWMPRVKANARNDFESGQRITVHDLFPDRQMRPAAQRPEYFPVAYIEPFLPNRQSLGLDHASVPARWQAMARARDEGRPVSSSREQLDLPENAPPLAATLIFLPIYPPAATVETVAERQTNLLGFAAIAIDLERLFDLVVPQSQGARSMELQLVLQAPGTPPQLLHALSADSQPWTNSVPMQDVLRFDLAGCQWTVISRPTELYPQRGDWESWGMLIGGLCLTVLLASYIYSMIGRTAKVERMVAVRTKQLAETNRQLQSEIIERKRTEEAITHSEARLQAILDNSTAVIYLKDLSGRFLLINREFERLFHVRREEIKGKTDLDLFAPSVADALIVNDRRSLAAGSALQMEEVVPVDGVERTYISIKFPLFDSTGAAYGICGISTDITERVQTTKALKDSEALFHSLVESLPLNVVRKDLQGRVTFGNELFCQTLGRPLNELIGKTDFDLFPAPLAEKYVADDQIVLSTGRVFEDVEAHHTAEGDDLYMHVLKSPVRDAEEHIVGLQVMFWDVTARKRAEKALESTAAELSRSNRELELFAYVASHDLQEPLRMIASYTQLLARRYKDKLDAEAGEYIKFAVDGAVRMQQLINDLLAYSRVGTKGKPFAPTDCEKVFETVLTNLKIAREESEATITHDPLPTVEADSVQLTQLWQNLLSNAMKFRGERAPVIHVGCEAQENEWRFSVRDNGIGIAPQYYERIFVIFQRLHTQQEYSGTGIGLALCKRIVERHGGKIWVESQPGAGTGTTFVFTLPRRPVAA